MILESVDLTIHEWKGNYGLDICFPLHGGKRQILEEDEMESLRTFLNDWHNAKEKK